MLAEITNAHLPRAPLPYYYHVKHSQFSAWNWNLFPKRNFNVPRPRPRLPFLIKAVAATNVEPKSNETEIDALNPHNHQPKSNDTEIDALNPHNHQPGTGIMLELPEQPVDEREKLRRLKISKANKGRLPWNTGRKHTPETLRKIKERTYIAMQNPKVRMKLMNLGHAQTTETRMKIGAGVRKKWENRRRMQMVQQTCFSDWKNLIAEASRQGFLGQEELQWNSYETLGHQLKQDWLVFLEQRKLIARDPSIRRGRRAPKSPEQRKKIAAAVAAKWANPDYRERVVSALTKYHLSTEKKPRGRPINSAQPLRKKKPITKKDSDNSILVKSSSEIVKPIKSPAYKDPLVNSKLQMIKNIRAQRASVDARQTQAIQQARLLIAEAEKAAKALEVAAATNPIAQSSLIETRKLIAEAIQSLESIDTQKTDDCNVPSEVNKENESAFEVGNHSQMTHVVNGHTPLSSSVYKLSEDFDYLSLGRPVNNGDPELHLTNGCAFLPFSLNSQINQYRSSNQEKETEQYESSENETDDSPLSRSDSPTEDETQSRSGITTKKWVRGRLVEVSEDQQ